MRAEDTLQYMVDFYPHSFPTRKHCLNQLFCVINNGFEWIDGELVDKNNKYMKRYELKELIEKADFPHEAQWYRMYEFYNRLYGDDASYKIPREYRFEWNRLCRKQSALFIYPENIKNDWLALIQECKLLLALDGISTF